MESKALYIHVPFCQSICSYCDFKRTLYNQEVANKWLERITSDLKAKKINQNLNSIYLGGGTPTSLTLNQLDKLLSLLDPFTSNLKEYTIESNIEVISADLIKLLVKHQVNRISLGVQSLNDDLLKVMNRKHCKKDVINALKIINQNGIDNISVDLIYGFFEQDIPDFENDLIKLSSNPLIKHISLYSLTIEENSILGKNHYVKVDNETEALMYERAIDILRKQGFNQYEVANFSRKNYESIHNKEYWYYHDFYGIGIGSSGKEKHFRYDISGSINDYLNHHETINKIKLTKKDEMVEFIMMNLRLREGINIKRFNELFKLDFNYEFNDIINRLIQNKDLIKNGDYLTTTKKGLLYLHDVIISFMEVIDERAYN